MRDNQDVSLELRLQSGSGRRFLKAGGRNYIIVEMILGRRRRYFDNGNNAINCVRVVGVCALLAGGRKRGGLLLRFCVQTQLVVVVVVVAEEEGEEARKNRRRQQRRR